MPPLVTEIRDQKLGLVHPDTASFARKAIASASGKLASAKGKFGGCHSGEYATVIALDGR
jgi:hypothetical protein